MKGTLLDNVVSAMESNELQAYYQPQYNAKKGVIGGAEALVRWVKPDGEIIPPSGFIPELEANGQVGIVDWFVAEEACKTIRDLGDKAIKISVNFGREHACDKDFINKLDKLVENYEIDKNYLGIEVTETDVAADKKLVVDWINSIEAAGYYVYIDDFGSGMSSLSFVKDVPAKVIKIDRSFLADNCQSEKGRITLESVFYFAHRLNLSTVVEGVETQEQLNFINTCDCDYIQGFIFSEPVPKDEFLLMCTEEAPVEMNYSDPIENQGRFGQLRTLVESVYKKFPLIIYANISKNSYHVMRKENYIQTKIPMSGSYDEGLKFVYRLLSEENKIAFTETFSRENLLREHKAGKKKVLQVLDHTNTKGKEVKIVVEDYFMENPSSNDVYIVSFIQKLNFADNNLQ